MLSWPTCFRASLLHNYLRLGPDNLAIINDASGAIILNFAMYIECPNDNDDNDDDDDDDDEDDDDDGVTIKMTIKQLSLLR